MVGSINVRRDGWCAISHGVGGPWWPGGAGSSSPGAQARPQPRSHRHPSGSASFRSGDAASLGALLRF